MTLAQIRSFVEATQKERKREIRELTVAVLAGSRYNQEALNDLFDKLE